MDERIRELEERLARAEAALAALGAHVAVTEDEGLRLTAPLRVMDSDGKPMVDLTLGASGPRLCLLNGGGTPVLIMDVLTTGGSVSIANPSGRAVAILFSDETGGDLALYDTDGKVTFSQP
jgi:hypothetical protein